MNSRFLEGGGHIGWDAPGEHRHPVEVGHPLRRRSSGPVVRMPGHSAGFEHHMPPYVTVYVSVDDLDETLSKVKDLGGTPLVPPTPIPGVGAFALFQDPEGNTIGILRMEGRTSSAC
jgi:catechol 2,3-dioxygenase-like lactoylglutathione lyase family enzyme